MMGIKAYFIRQNARNRALALLFCFFFAPFGTNATEKWSVQELQSLLIQAQNLKITFQKAPSSFYSVTGGTEDFSFVLKEGQLKIQSKDFSSKKQWHEKDQKLELVFSGPSSIPVEIFSGQLEMSIKNWNSRFFISSFKASIDLRDTAGTWDLDFYEAQVFVKNHKGAFNLKSFQTKLDFKNSQGVVDLQVNKGQIKVKDSKGQLNIVGNDLKMDLNNFEGDIEGFTQLGEVKASLKPEQLKLKTGQAPISVNVHGRGVQVLAWTQQGQIYAPRYLNKKYEGKSIRVSGRIRSKIKKGEINIETEKGNIRVY